jgi:hypothetical protein
MNGLEKMIGVDTLMMVANARNPTLSKSNCKIRYASHTDREEIYQMQLKYKDLDYSRKAIEDILCDKNAVNIAIERKDDGKIVNYALSYPASNYHKNQKNMNWKVATKCNELKDKNSFYLELVETAPEYQGRGLYKLMKKFIEAAAYKKGYDKMYLHSIESAVKAHEKTGCKMVKELPNYWIGLNGSTTTDAYLMEDEFDHAKISASILDIFDRQENKEQNKEPKQAVLCEEMVK